MSFVLFAKPWWVNLLIFVPSFTYFAFRKGRLRLTRRQLFLTGVFGAAFGFVEASVVVYLREALGLTSVYNYEQIQILNSFSGHLLTVELFREFATLVMLTSVALVVGKNKRERWAVFLWTFALWDICYYAGLYATVRWPPSLFSYDVLFLIPTPWLSQVWFPLVVDGLTMWAVIATIF